MGFRGVLVIRDDSGGRGINIWSFDLTDFFRDELW